MVRNFTALALVGLMCGDAFGSDSGAMQFGDIDTSRGIENTASQLNDVVRGSSAKFETVISGVDGQNRSVLVGGRSDEVLLISATWRGILSSNDLRDIAELEREFGLEGMSRAIREQCAPEFSPGAGMNCTQIDYGCTEAAVCPVRILSFFGEGSDTAGRIRVSWEALP